MYVINVYTYVYNCYVCITFVCTYVCTCTTCVTFYTCMYIRVVISTKVRKQWSNQHKYQVRLTVLVYMVQFSHNITDACILQSCSRKSICNYAMVHVSKCMYVRTHTRKWKSVDCAHAAIFSGHTGFLV